MSEHTIKVKRTELYECDVTPKNAEMLTYDGERTKYSFEGGQKKLKQQGPDLEFEGIVKCVYECRCGKRFRKGETAREHLEKFRDEEGDAE